MSLREVQNPAGSNSVANAGSSPKPGAPIVAPAAPSTPDFDILYLGTENLISGQFSRSQALAIQLARTFRVLYANTDYCSLPHYVHDRVLLRGAQRRVGLRPVATNLWTIDFITLVPYRVALPRNRINVWVVAQQLRRAVRRLSFRDCLLWIANPWATPIIKHIPACMVCYDYMDDFPALLRGRRGERRAAKRIEEQLLRACDFVVASSEPLRVKGSALNSHVHLVRNGVAIDLYGSDGTPTPLEFRNLQRPILGYVGYVGHWLDLDLLKALALRYREASVVVVGPVNTSLRGLSAVANIHFLGMRPHAEMPRYIGAFDVCLIPFKQNELTIAANPIKFYEYSAAGKPTVSVRLPELEPYEDVCYLARSREEFLGAVGIALREREDLERAARLAVRRRTLAQENSWEIRRRQLEAILLSERKRVAVSAA
jgi:hypothetical protein